jgi:hypothetical protein
MHTLHSHEDLESEMVTYYQDLLSEPLGDRSQSIAQITQHIPSTITAEQNDALIKPIMIEEVDQALHDTPIGKYLWLDGFTSKIFQHCWTMVREEVWDIIDYSRASIQVLLALNAAFLTHIPKEEQVNHPKQF